MGYSLWGHKEFTRLGTHTHVCCYFTPHPHPLSMYFKMVDFMLCIFYHNEKRKKICCYELSVNGVSQARILEWVAISFSRRSSPPRD